MKTKRENGTKNKKIEANKNQVVLIYIQILIQICICTCTCCQYMELGKFVYFEA